MHLLFLNQYGPGDDSPTARLLRDLVEDCRARGHRVTVIAAAADYRQKTAHGWRRWGREFAGLGRLLAKAFGAPRADVVISFSSPPGLVFIGALVAAWHRARSIHWVLDLYPDLAMVLGESRSPVVTRLVSELMNWAYRRTDIVVTLDEDMQARLRGKGVSAEIIPAWLPLQTERVVELKSAPSPSWIYSGNLGRAHEWLTLLQVQEAIEKADSKIELIIQGGGAGWIEAQEWARQHGLQRCLWRDYANEEELPLTLLQSSVLVATQRPETKGMLWPSKLALLLQLPRPILWVGPVEGAAARAIASHAGGAGRFQPGEIKRVTDWLLQIMNRDDASAHPFLVTLHPDRQTGLESWRKFLNKLN